jgi:ribokinase
MKDLGMKDLGIKDFVVVIGSLNMDLVARVSRMPGKGETLTGSDFRTIPGGKGANQAVAAGKLGANVAMVGRVGMDGFGEELTQNLNRCGVETERVKADAGAPTGVALITVDDQAENSIVVIPGANGRCQASDVDEAEVLIARAGVVMLQLEVPLEVVERAAEVAGWHGVPVLLDPAPARALPGDLWPKLAIVTPNEGEATMLAGITVNDVASAGKAGEWFLGRGVKRAIIKLGARGAVICDSEAGNCRIEHVPGYPVKAIDTTAAGDAFAGGLARTLVNGASLREAVQFANAVGALSATKLGAQASMPSLAEVEQFLKAQ